MIIKGFDGRLWRSEMEAVYAGQQKKDMGSI